MERITGDSDSRLKLLSRRCVFEFLKIKLFKEIFVVAPVSFYGCISEVNSKGFYSIVYMLDEIHQTVDSLLVIVILDHNKIPIIFSKNVIINYDLFIFNYKR